MPDIAVAAVDLGASSGRVMVATVGPGRLDLRELHRFTNAPVEIAGRLFWDILHLHQGVLDGLRAAGRDRQIASVGIDAWAVDYGLIDAEGQLLGNPVHYRDSRTRGVMDTLLTEIPADDLYAITGIQQLSFNTIYQLVAAAGTAQLAAARTMLLVPDLLAYWLTGELGAEATNASTTQLYDVREHTWSWPLIRRAGLPRHLFPALREPGGVIGTFLPRVAAATELAADTKVIAVGSHDTASAVVSVPADGRRFAYISCGTWSLVGVELDHAVLTQASRMANFTNEGGVDGRIRYLRNVTGLWLLQESVRTWATAGLPADVATLLQEAARVPAFTALVDVDDPRFLAPGDIPARIAGFCRESAQVPPQSQAETVRCILDSLALAYRRAVRQAQALSGQGVDVVHIVGGGTRNELLCQLTADACGLPVLAGPVESAALGNALIQARTLGAAPADLPAMRALVWQTQDIRTYTPSMRSAAWDRAEERIRGAAKAAPASGSPFAQSAAEHQ